MVPFSFHVTISPRLPGNVVLFSVRKNVSYAYWLPSEHVRMYVCTNVPFVHSFYQRRPHASFLYLSLSLSCLERTMSTLLDGRRRRWGKKHSLKGREGSERGRRIYWIGPLHFGRTFCLEVAGFMQPSARHGSIRKRSHTLGTRFVIVTINIWQIICMQIGNMVLGEIIQLCQIC